MAEEGKLDPFVLVVEGSIPNEKIKSEGYWAALGHRSRHRPADHDQRMDRPAGAQGAGRRGVRHLRHLRRHSRHGGQSDRLHGTGRLPGLGLDIEGRPADRERARLSGAARQLHGDAALPALPGGGPGADDSARRPAAARPGCSARPSTRAATAPAITSRATSPTSTALPSAS